MSLPPTERVSLSPPPSVPPKNEAEGKDSPEIIKASGRKVSSAEPLTKLHEFKLSDKERAFKRRKGTDLPDSEQKLEPEALSLRLRGKGEAKTAFEMRPTGQRGMFRVVKPLDSASIEERQPLTEDQSTEAEQLPQAPVSVAEPIAKEGATVFNEPAMKPKHPQRYVRPVVGPVPDVQDTAIQEPLFLAQPLEIPEPTTPETLTADISEDDEPEPSREEKIKERRKRKQQYEKRRKQQRKKEKAAELPDPDKVDTLPHTEKPVRGKPRTRARKINPTEAGLQKLEETIELQRLQELEVRARNLQDEVDSETSSGKKLKELSGLCLQIMQLEKDYTSHVKEYRKDLDIQLLLGVKMEVEMVNAHISISHLLTIFYRRRISDIDDFAEQARVKLESSTASTVDKRNWMKVKITEIFNAFRYIKRLRKMSDKMYELTKEGEASVAGILTLTREFSHRTCLTLIEVTEIIEERKFRSGKLLEARKAIQKDLKNMYMFIVVELDECWEDAVSKEASSYWAMRLVLIKALDLYSNLQVCIQGADMSRDNDIIRESALAAVQCISEKLASGLDKRRTTITGYQFHCLKMLEASSCEGWLKLQEDKVKTNFQDCLKVMATLDECIKKRSASEEKLAGLSVELNESMICYQNAQRHLTAIKSQIQRAHRWEVVVNEKLKREKEELDRLIAWRQQLLIESEKQEKQQAAKKNRPSAAQPTSVSTPQPVAPCDSQEQDPQVTEGNAEVQKSTSGEIGHKIAEASAFLSRPKQDPEQAIRCYQALQERERELTDEQKNLVRMGVVDALMAQALSCSREVEKHRSRTQAYQIAQAEGQLVSRELDRSFVDTVAQLPNIYRTFTRTMAQLGAALDALKLDPHISEEGRQMLFEFMEEKFTFISQRIEEVTKMKKEIASLYKRRGELCSRQLRTDRPKKKPTLTKEMVLQAQEVDECFDEELKKCLDKMNSVKEDLRRPSPQ